MPNPSEKEPVQNDERYSHKKVFEGIGHLFFTDDGAGFLVLDLQREEVPYFDPAILNKRIGMIELFEGDATQQEFRITVERRPKKSEPEA